MGIQITVDPSNMSKEQLEVVACFILSYPSQTTAENDEAETNIPECIRPDPVEAFAVKIPAPVQTPELPPAPPPSPESANIPPPPSIELDSKNVQWDPSLHSQSKAKNADGTWRKRRGLDKELMPPASSMQVAPTPVTDVLTPASAPPPFPMTPTSQPTPKVFNETEARAKFVALVGRATAAIQSGKITQNEITKCCIRVGVSALPLLANRLDLVERVSASVDAIIGA